MSRRLPVYLALCLLTSLGCDFEYTRRQLDPEGGPPAELVIRTETRERKEFGRQMRLLLLAGQYDSLDQIARGLRQQQVKWPNGGWKLRSFYREGFDQPDLEESETQWKTMLSHLREWVAAKPGSITARVALAYALTGYAWHARGNGWAREVSDAGWRLFHDRLREAESVMLDAQRLPESCPGAAVVLQRVALGLGWPRSQYDSLFEAAVRAEPSYEVYYELKAQFLLPRWGGRKGEWERFAEEAADRLGGVEGDMMYARIVWSKDEYYPNVFEQSAASWERTSRGYQELLRRYPHSLELQSQYAWLAAQAEDRDAARLMFERMGPRVDHEVWKTRDYFVTVRNWSRY
jgi:hypothetical protein